MARHLTWRGQSAPPTLRHLVLRLYARRTELRLSQRAAAGLAGVSQSQVSDIELLSTEPRLSTLANYARVLGFDLHVELRERRTGS